jgi:isochorismate synthase
MEQRLLDSNKQNILKKAISHLLSEQLEFAMFAHPESNDITAIVATNYNSDKGFHIQDFKGNLNYFIPGDWVGKDSKFEEILTLKNSNKTTFFHSDEVVAMSKNDFENYVNHIIEKCKNGEIEKCVAARKLQIKLKKDIASIFIELLINYPKGFVNLSVSKFGIWMGATPEILIKQTAENKFETMSLAGTKKTEENRNWTEKEIEEQAIVTRYIEEKLKPHCSEIEISETQTHFAGHLQHLKSTIKLTSEKTIAQLAEILHPTPAVCGLPLDKAFQIIEEKESDRSIYAGFMGPILEDDKTMYVNLRCMQINNQNATLFVGAGITKDSIAENEWEETAAKAQTLLKYL